MTPGGERARVLHPRQHDTVGVLIFDFGYTFRVERFIAIPVPSQVVLMVCWGVFVTYTWRKATVATDSRCRAIGIYMDVDDLLLYKQSNP
jgi:hypothetical protein